MKVILTFAQIFTTQWHFRDLFTEQGGKIN
jgi:hypothetical protein